MSEPSATVADNPDRSRYEVRADGETAGFAAYRRLDDRLVFTHTEIDDRFGGRGLGSVLAREALDDVRRQGLLVTPQCPFIAHFIRTHQEYADLVDPEHADDVRPD
jgi:predicted GNAT family acetyltransferase